MKFYSNSLTLTLLVFIFVFGGQSTIAQLVKGGEMDVGVARIDITPEGSMRMAGHIRKVGSDGGVKPFDKALHKLHAKALAFGSDVQGPSLLITCDLLAIPGYITREVARRLYLKNGLDTASLAISSSHTHSGPEVGNTMNLTKMFSDPPVTSEEMTQIAIYVRQLTDKLERVAQEALHARQPSLVSWGQGKVTFAINRRLVENGKWVAQRNVPKGPVDHSLPLLRVTDLNGKLRAVFVNYACHCTTLGGNITSWHGDWNGEAQRLIEINHPDATALVAAGCGADANPDLPRGKLEDATFHGKEIADEVERLLASSLQNLNTPPKTKFKVIEIPFAKVPTINDLSQAIKEGGPKAFNATVFLEQLVSGVPIPTTLSYPVQTWTFGNEMAMLFLGGEVVVDYSLRLKKELGAERLWVNAYSNDVRCYIPSRRVLREGGYEAEGHIYFYNQPSRLSEEVEDLIVASVHELLPASFKAIKGNTTNLLSEINSAISLNAENGKPIGPKIKYMPEWRAFGWFTSEDHIEWNLNIPRKGEYKVYMEWSVSDSDAGQEYILEAGNQKVEGKVEKTGSWETFKVQQIGSIKMSSGSQKITFKPKMKFKTGGLLDFREIVLVPAN